MHRKPISILVHWPRSGTAALCMLVTSCTTHSNPDAAVASALYKRLGLAEASRDEVAVWIPAGIQQVAAADYPSLQFRERIYCVTVMEDAWHDKYADWLIVLRQDGRVEMKGQSHDIAAYVSSLLPARSSAGIYDLVRLMGRIYRGRLPLDASDSSGARPNSEVLSVSCAASGTLVRAHFVGLDEKANRTPFAITLHLDWAGAVSAEFRVESPFLTY